MAKKEEQFDARKYMEMAIEVMNQSVQEPRSDKVSPSVGAVLIKPDGTVETAFRGELRHGDHAEFTLLERKNRSTPLDGSILFATLEPCAPGARKHPKLGCAERIVNARIKKVWVGIEDPDPLVDRKGLKYLEEYGVEVEMFPPDLQQTIRAANSRFIKEAEERASTVEEKKAELVLSETERVADYTDAEDLDEERIFEFLNATNPNYVTDVALGLRVFTQLGLMERIGEKHQPTGLGLLMFGKQPQFKYPNALIRATYRRPDGKEEIETFQGPITKQPAQAIAWFKERIGSHVQRNEAQREEVSDYPIEVIREALTNAIVHRDYDIGGAPIQFEINSDAVIIKSPGAPVHPIRFEQIRHFNAPVLSRNPKIIYVFDQLGLVEQRGLGFTSMKQLPEKHGLPLPLVSMDEPYMVFTFPRTSSSLRASGSLERLKELSEDEIMGYEWIRSQDEVTAMSYANRWNLTERSARRHFSKFRDLGLIVDNGESPNSPKFGYKAS